jgi:hypothetical protein
MYTVSIGAATSGELTENLLSQVDVYRMIQRSVLSAGIRTQIGNHSFRATGITEYLRNAWRIEKSREWPAG